MKNYRKLFAWLMTVIMLVGMIPAASAELAGPVGPVNCNHVWDGGQWSKGEPANCRDWKPKTYTCTLCQATFTNEEAGRCVAGPKTWVIPQATNCQEHGVWEICCKVCGEWMDGMEEPGPHNWVTRTVEEPTYEYPGWKSTECSYCGSEQSGPVEIPALGHDWTDWEWDGEPTCVEGGWQHRTCRRCRLREDREVGSGQHNMGEWYRNGLPTCTEDGVARRNCQRCDYYETKPIPKVNHEFGEWRVVEEPQVGLPGYERRFCVYQCGTYEEREIPPLEGETPIALPELQLLLYRVSNPANGEYFVLGEQVVFTASWSNLSDYELYPFYASIWPYEQPEMIGAPLYACSWDAEQTGPVSPGAVGSFDLVHTVTEEDIARGGIYAMAIIMCSVNNGPQVEDVTTPFVTARCGSGSGDVTPDLEGLFVRKSAPHGSHNNFYYVGEAVPFTITVTNNTGVELKDVVITDPIVGGDGVVGTAASLQPDESVTVVFNYTVTEADAVIGIEYFDNIAYATGYTADGTQVSGTSLPVGVWCVIPHEVTLTKTVGNSPANGEYFVPGELIVFKVYIKNETPYPFYGVTLTDPLCEDQHFYDEENDMSYIFFDDLSREGAGGDTIFDQRISLDYIVTEADAEAGFVTNTAFVEYMTWYGEEKTASASATAKCGKPTDAAAGLTVTWTYTNTPANGEYFTPGEVIDYLITVTNTGSVALMNLYVGCAASEAVIPSPREIAPGQTIQVPYYKLVYEENAKAGGINSYAHAHAATGEPATIENSVDGRSDDLFVPCGMGNGSPAVYYLKTVNSAPANGLFFTEGETIKYRLAFGNNTKKDIYNITLNDPMANTRAVAFARRLKAGEYLMGEFEYTVTAADVEAGQIVNTATSTWATKAEGALTTTLSNTIVTPCGSGDPTTDRVDAMLEKYVSNAPANGEYFVPGETIEYAVIFMNVCPHDLHDVEVMDPLKGSNEDAVITREPVVEREGTLYLSFNYVVTEEDAERGYVENTASAFWLNPEIEEWSSCESNTVITETGYGESTDLGLAVTKTITSTPANGMYYVPGEEIHFLITVQNNMDKALDVVVLTDPLSADFYHEIEGIAAGDSASRSLIYTVTEIGAEIGYVNNCAYAVAYVDGKPHSMTSNTVTAPCGFPDNDGDGQPDGIFGIHICLEVTKEVESLPLNGKFYQEGETVAYKITYVNAGEMPLTDVMIYDALAGFDEVATAETLQPGESRVCYVNYTVTYADTVAGSIANTAIGQYLIGDYLNTVTSNTVVVPANGFTVHQYVPGTPEEPGTIDPGKLPKGKSSCVVTITGKDNASASYEISFCADHVAAQSTVLMMKQAANTPEMQMQTAAYAVALWRTEVEKLYRTVLEAADNQAKMNIMTEYIRFMTEVANYEAMLKVLHPDQPAVVAQKIADIWEDKCVTLCYEIHTATDQRKDSLLSVTTVIGATAADCTCTVTAETTGIKAYTQGFCATHAFPFGMIDMLLQGKDTAEAWAMVRQIWTVELNSAYDKVNTLLGDSRELALAEFAAMTQWMTAREAYLTALYPNNPEVVAQTMVKIIMDRVNDLCLTGK